MQLRWSGLADKQISKLQPLCKLALHKWALSEALQVDLHRFTLPMRMPVVDVRKVRMAVLEWHMLMRVGVRLGTVPFEIVAMLMVFIVPVLVAVLQLSMRVFMGMVLGQMEPHACGHQGRRHPEAGTGGFCKCQNSNCSTDKRRCRKISACARRAQSPQCQHKQHKTQAITQKADQHRSG